MAAVADRGNRADRALNRRLWEAGLDAVPRAASLAARVKHLPRLEAENRAALRRRRGNRRDPGPNLSGIRFAHDHGEDRRMREVIDRLERIEGRLATQSKQLGRQEALLVGHGEQLGRQERLLVRQGEQLEQQEQWLRAHGEQLERQEQLLVGHGRQLARQAQVLVAHGEQLADHGEKLRVIIQSLAPLPAIEAFIRALGDDHEMRIRALEGKRAGS